MPQDLELYDVTIVGGGPVGLFTAFYSGMREMKTKVIEYLPFLGGKVPYFYPEKMIYDIGGIPRISGEAFTEQLIDQAKTFEPEIVLNEQVMHMEKQPSGHFLLKSNNGARHLTKTVILATGYGTLKSVKLDLPEAADFEGTSLHYAIRKMSDYKGKNVLISGGGNSAIDWANELEGIANSVSVVYRKSTFTGIERNISKMMSSAVNVYKPYQIISLSGENGQLASAIIAHTENAIQEEVPIDNVIVNHGFVIDLGPISEWDMKMQEGSIVVDGRMETSVPGIFAVGDISNYPNKLNLIAGGFHDGPIAVNNAKLHIAPKEELKPLYSTNYEPLINKK
ncbi:NAD(P)/FAD-dependent oxidoreductase [Oceanobacillus manasiensis]|uniref:NAD(P)/FAD-dependent oxidoreductase n=1 Tax=Oceanobacillus manasiensis TaxID=586413 RepID=UPI0005AB0593|nr:NAD(P)/FAD-dependent oxidoreductase [Oceanobacillus manasiensis]